MRYYMKSKFFKIKEDFWIKDEHNQDAFFVDNKFMTLGLQFDMIKNNTILYSVKEKLIAFMPSYEVYENNLPIARVSQKITFLKDKLHVDSKYGDLVVKGSLFDYNYKIYNGSRMIAEINKEFFAFTDNYLVDIDFEDEGFLLTLVVIIDNIIDKHKN